MNRFPAVEVKGPMVQALRTPSLQLLFSVAFFGASLFPFAKVCLGC